MVVDGLALVLVGAGLTAVVLGYERNLPKPVADVAGLASDWADPATTGSIAPRIEDASTPAASARPSWKVGAMSQSWAPGTRVWTDPQYR